MSKNKVFAIIGPGGCGKGSIIKELKKHLPNFSYPISYTSRNIRENEEPGDTYHFISKSEFESKIKNDDFLEYQLIHNQYYYGSDKKEILSSLQTQNLIREIDYQGFKDISKTIPKSQLVSIFITTQNWAELAKRIQSRQKISAQNLKQREVSYQKEMIFSKTCDYVIANHNQQLDITVHKILTIIKQHI